MPISSLVAHIGHGREKLSASKIFRLLLPPLRRVSFRLALPIEVVLLACVISETFFVGHVHVIGSDPLCLCEVDYPRRVEWYLLCFLRLKVFSLHHPRRMDWFCFGFSLHHPRRMRWFCWKCEHPRRMRLFLVIFWYCLLGIVSLVCVCLLQTRWMNWFL